MKNTVIFILISILCLSMLLGCADGDGTATAEVSDEAKKEHILSAWTGEFSSEKRKAAIHEYEKNYAPFEFNSEAPFVSIETDYEISSSSVPLLSRTDKNDISVELDGYIDLVVRTERDGNKIKVYTDWWTYGGWTQECKVWSYLVRTEDKDGNEHYYYFRVDYSSYSADNTEAVS